MKEGPFCVTQLKFMGLRDDLRMYCIDTPGVPESNDAGTFHRLYD